MIKMEQISVALTSAISKLEQSTDITVLGDKPSVFLKEIAEDILKYEQTIIALYHLPIGDQSISDKGKERSIKHDKVITDLNMLRRVCEKLGIEDPYAGEEITERHDYALIAFEFLRIILSDN